jgi:hypothetical protein
MAIWVYPLCHQFPTAPSVVQVVDAPLGDRGEERKTSGEVWGRDTKLGAIMYSRIPMLH